MEGRKWLFIRLHVFHSSYVTENITSKFATGYECTRKTILDIELCFLLFSKPELFILMRLTWKFLIHGGCASPIAYFADTVTLAEWLLK